MNKRTSGPKVPRRTPAMSSAEKSVKKVKPKKLSKLEEEFPDHAIVIGGSANFPGPPGMQDYRE